MGSSLCNVHPASGQASVRDDIRPPALRTKWADAELPTVPTHGDYPWERDERASRKTHDPPGIYTPPPTSTPAPRQPTPSWSGGLALRRRLTAVEVGAAVTLVALLLWLKWDRLSLPHASPLVSAGPPPPGLVTRPPGRRNPAALSGLHSRLVTRSRVEVWGRVDAADGTTVRLTVSSPGAGPVRLALAPATARHFYTTARVPLSMRGHRITVTASLGT
jgi:hypothetical protein